MCLFFSKCFSRVFRKKELLLVIAGLEYAGKTTILYRLKKQKPPMECHTIGHNVETVEYNNIKFVFMDVSIRAYRPNESRMWKHFFYMSQALIFVVDSSDREHVMEAKDELHKLWNHDELKDAVLLVFANKQDEPNAMNVEELTDELDLHSLKDNRHWHIQSTCATSGDGLYQGLEWIANNRSHR